MIKKRMLISLSIVLCIVLLSSLICIAMNIALSVDSSTEFNVESLRWSIIGAIGGWVGSIFGAVALIVSLFALWIPQRVKMAVEISEGLMIGNSSEIDRIDAYIITVKNTGIKPITVNNVYLHFGNKKQRDIYVGMLNRETMLEAFTPSFPKRLEQGGSFDYYLHRGKLNSALAHYEEKTPIDTPLSIRIDEVTEGTQYYKTKWTLGSFIGK